MKTTTIFVIVLLVVFIFSSDVLADKKTQAISDWPVLKGPYLGQKPPGLKAEIFAPGIISTELHDDAAPIFSPDGKKIFFRIVYKIEGKYYGTHFYVMQENGIWSYPKVAPFSGKFMDTRLCFSPDGKTLYWSSSRAKTYSLNNYDLDLWRCKLSANNWGKPEHLKALSTKGNESNIGSMLDGSLLWCVRSKDKKKLMKYYTAQLEGDNFSKPIETKQMPSDPEKLLEYVVSPKGDYMIVTIKEPNNDFNLYVSFKEKNGSWGKPKTLGNNVNSRWMDKAAGITPDGKYMFFVSSRHVPNRNPKKHWDNPILQNLQEIFTADIFWVDTKIIDYLKNEDLDVISILEKTMIDKGIQALKEKYMALKARHATFYTFDADALNDLSKRFFESKKSSEALKIAEFNIQLHPNSVEAYVHLGKAYEVKNENKTALNMYKKALNIAEKASMKNLDDYQYYIDGILSKMKRLKLMDNFPTLKGKYLGQKPPGIKAERFMPDIFFSTFSASMHYELHGCPVFTPGGKEVYFVMQSRDIYTKKYHKAIMVMKVEDGQWGKPVPVSFQNDYSHGTPFISTDGKKMFFASERLNANKKNTKDIWYVERKGNEWGKPLPVSHAINSEMREACPSVASNGNFYFYRRFDETNGSGEIFFSKYQNGKYKEAIRLGSGINTPKYEFFPMVAPHEHFLLFCRYNPGGDSGIFISFKNPNGKWSKGKYLNLEINEGGPFSMCFSPDGKYLFFLLRKSTETRERGIYWISTEALKNNWVISGIKGDRKNGYH